MTSRILGLDPGERRIGVAVSDPTCTIASPYGFVDVAGGKPIKQIESLCAELEIAEVVVGLPLRLDGSEGPAALRSRQLAEDIVSALEIKVALWDERFTTVTAEQALIEGNVSRAKRKTRRDQVAAAVMLQGYLEGRKHNGGHGNTTRPGE